LETKIVSGLAKIDRVFWFAGLGIDEMVFDASSSSRLFGQAADTGRDVERDFRKKKR
jgi:hypothetical protein